MTIKNRKKKVEIETIFRPLGNWNYKNRDAKIIYTKPIAVIKIDGDEFVFSHDDIIKILEAYNKVDVESIDMISNPDIDTGEVKGLDKSFVEKIIDWVRKNGK